MQSLQHDQAGYPKQIGRALRGMRESMELSIKHVSLTLGISTFYIIGIEESRLDLLPDYAETISLYQRYTEFLGLDVELVTKLIYSWYDSLHYGQAPARTPRPPLTKSKTSKPNRRKLNLSKRTLTKRKPSNRQISLLISKETPISLAKKYCSHALPCRQNYIPKPTAVSNKNKIFLCATLLIILSTALILSYSAPTNRYATAEELTSHLDKQPPAPTRIQNVNDIAESEQLNLVRIHLERFGQQSLAHVPRPSSFSHIRKAADPITKETTPSPSRAKFQPKPFIDNRTPEQVERDRVRYLEKQSLQTSN